jgi:dihydrolipoamide dehydrogenase
METNIPGIWAIGDIAGKYQFKHSANLEAQNAIQNAFHKKTKIDYTAMPHASFTSPQTASVGKTEQELKGTQYTKTIYKYNKTGYGKAIEDNDGFVKVLKDKQGKILGCHIIGTNASILIHEVIIAMKNGLTADQIAQTVHVHPALSEVVQRAFLQ